MPLIFNSYMLYPSRKRDPYMQHLVSTTANGAPKCQCGINTQQEIVDMGDAGNWPLFPIVALRLGDTGQSHESIRFRIGPLICEQGKSHREVFCSIKLMHKFHEIHIQFCRILICHFVEYVIILGVVSIQRCRLTSIGIPIKRRSHDQSLYLKRQSLYCEGAVVHVIHLSIFLRVASSVSTTCSI